MKVKTKIQKKHTGIFAFTAIFAGIGTYLLVNSFAATPVDQVVPYDSASPWNQPIPANVQVDSNSANNIQFLSSLNKGLTSDVTTCTIPVYTFDSSTPRADVTISGNYREYLTGDNSESANTKPARNVAIPAVAAAEQGCDGQIEFWNPTTGEQFGFWLFGGNASAGYHAENGYHYFTKAGFYGRFAGGHAGRGAGTPYLAGLVRPWELYQGRIDHAIAFAYQYPCCGDQSSAGTTKKFVYPAAKSDGASDNLSSAPEGARFQLNPNLTDAQIQNSPTHATTPGLGCTGPCFTIAKALQKYGMYSIDNSGSSKIYLEDNSSANWDLSALGISSTSAIRNIPSKLTPNNDWSNFRVVAPPCNPVTTTCSTGTPPGPTANLWMDADGGSCTYSYSTTTYSDASACADFNTACSKVPTGVTLTVLVKGGTYASSKTSLSNCKPTGKITFQEVSGENAITNGVYVQDTNNISVDGFYIDITNNGDGAGSYFVCTQNITLKNLEIEGDHSQGTSYGDAVQVWPRDDDTRPLCYNKNFSLDHVYIHDLHTYVPAEDNHTDCVQAAASEGLTILNSRLVNCGTQSFQLNADSWPCNYTPNCALLTDVKIENSWVGTGGTIGGMTNFSARNNVFINAPNFDPAVIKGSKVITGNILDLPQSYHCGVYSGKGVSTSVTFKYNIADVDCPTGTNSIKVTNLNSLFVNASTSNADTWDLHLAGNNAAVGAMPFDLAPTTDYDGDARPQTGNVDIGADQRTGTTPPPTAKPGDTNADNLVNIVDLSTLLSKWNTNFSSADFNKDSTVNVFDLSILLSNYGK